MRSLATLRRAMLGVLSVVTLGGPSACVRRPDDAQCRAMADHLVMLHRRSQEGRAADLAAEVTDQRHTSIVIMCLEDGTLTEVQCVLDSNSLERIPYCAPR